MIASACRAVVGGSCTLLVASYPGRTPGLWQRCALPLLPGPAVANARLCNKRCTACLAACHETCWALVLLAGSFLNPGEAASPIMHVG